MQRKRKLYLTIHNYKDEVVCDLYDNQNNITGQATNVHITTERNGWKELSFEIPSTCMTEEGEVENFRLKYLIAEYKIRAIDDNKVDWFIISEPKISRNNFSKNVSVVAGHISQLLKHKNLDLEFSDDEGNNTGKAEEILATILEGTDWNVGHVGEQNSQGVWHTFLEDDGETAKIRSITAQAGTGALRLIEKLCDTFEAKPIYYINEDGKKTVDIIPMNPFAKIQQEQIPALLRDRNLDVLELHYDRNIHSLNKTINTENMATRLYAYGSSGDKNGACTLQNAIHHEWNFIINELADEYMFSIGDNNFYFIGDVSISDSLIWSDMDITSMSYIYNDTKKIAYKVYKEPTTGSYKSLTAEDPIDVPNRFAYLLGLKYYDDVGLMTEEQFQEIASFQRSMPAYYETIMTNSEAFNEGENKLSELAEHATGLLKLEIANVVPGEETEFFIDTSVGENGVIYRNDYEKAERRYFQWHVTDRLNNNGQPITGTPSVLFIVHDTDPVTYDMTYLKSIRSNIGDVVDEEGMPNDFTYSTGVYPISFKVWGSYSKHPKDRFYLFCTDSMHGMLGSRLSQIEAVYQDLYNATMKHPVIFYDADSNLENPSPTGSEYEWKYDYHNAADGELYFCWNDKFAETWQRVYIGDTFPDETKGYFYDTRHKCLYRYNDSEWSKIEDKQITARMFETVIYYCKRRDELFRGIYEYYFYDHLLEVGNYAIYDGYNAYWLFKLKEQSGNILLDYIKGYIFSDVIFDENNNPIVSSNISSTTQSVETRSVIYPTDNELSGKTFYPGTINDQGIENKTDFTKYKTNYISVDQQTEYYYYLPEKSVVYLYNSDKEYESKINILNIPTGSFNTGDNAFIRLVTDDKIIILDNASANNYIVPEDEEDNNLLKDRPFIDGSIDDYGQDLNVDRYRTYTIPCYENTTYEYLLPADTHVYYYDMNLNYIGRDVLTSTANVDPAYFTTRPNATNMRFVSSTDDMRGYYVHIQDYDKKFYMNREPYIVLDDVNKMGELIGITPLVKKFADLADKIYTEYLKNLLEAQEAVKNKEKSLAELLGDMLKDGRWQDSNYIKGDEKRLYDDALYMLRQVSYPETSYSFTYLDMFCVQNEHFYEVNDVSWPDIEITQTAHLVDTESKTNCWAYIDKINKCYDKPWETTVDVDTKLTLASRHGFTDVIARIAETAKQIKAKESLYDQAATGKISGSRLEGTIDLNRVYLNGGSSNWYNDEKGNLIFESADGLSAMMLGGRGLGIATERADDGSWMWRTAATGYGMAADSITTGYLSADRIEAGAVTLDKLSSNVGKELEIGSNKALVMFATEDGSRPAGSLRTTDGLIEVIAGQDNIPAKINVVSGGELNLNGGQVKVYSKGQMDVSSGGRFVLKSQDMVSMNSDGNGLFIDSEEGVNFAGGKFKLSKNGTGMSLAVKADILELGQDENATIKMNAADKTIDINSATITIKADSVLNLITEGHINIGKTNHLFTIGGDNDKVVNDKLVQGRSYIYNGLSSTDGSDEGVYIGTDGFALKQGSTKFVAANGEIALSTGSSTGDYVSLGVKDEYRIWAGDPDPGKAPFSVQQDGTIYASKGTIGSFSLDGQKFYGGSGDNYVEINVNNKKSIDGNTLLYPYAIWCGSETASNAPFYIKKDGTGKIGGFTIGKTSLWAGSGTTKIELNADPNKTYSLLIGDNNTNNYFEVSKTGTATMKGATVKGTIEATTGLIAGWKLDGNRLIWETKSHNVTVAKIGLAAYDDNSTPNAIWVGASANYNKNTSTYSANRNGNGAPFRVTHDGILYTTGATINSATINSTSIDKATITNGSISSATITGGSFSITKKDNDGVTRTLFAVTTGGKMFVRPSVNPGAGGFYFDANDMAGPWMGLTSEGVNKASSGFVQINCNPDWKTGYRFAAGACGPDGKGKPQFYVTGEGHIHCNYIYCEGSMYVGGNIACATVNGREI